MIECMTSITQESIIIGFNNMKKTFRKCPLCNEPVKHIKHKRDIDTAHVWICSKCPFV